MKIRIKFPEEVLISEGAEWDVELPVVVGNSVVIPLDEDNTRAAIEIVLLPRE